MSVARANRFHHNRMCRRWDCSRARLETQTRRTTVASLPPRPRVAQLMIIVVGRLPFRCVQHRPIAPLPVLLTSISSSCRGTKCGLQVDDCFLRPDALSLARDLRVFSPRGTWFSCVRSNNHTVFHPVPPDCPVRSKPRLIPRQMLSKNFTLERLVVGNTDMTEAGFTAVLAALREGNNTLRELSIGSQLFRSREVRGFDVCKNTGRTRAKKQNHHHQQRRRRHVSGTRGQSDAETARLSDSEQTPATSPRSKRSKRKAARPFTCPPVRCPPRHLVSPTHDNRPDRTGPDRIGSEPNGEMQEVAACHVARMLETPPSMLRSLDLSRCGMGDEGAYVLRGALMGHPTMRTLDLSRNRIGITGGQV